MPAGARGCWAWTHRSVSWAASRPIPRPPRSRRVFCDPPPRDNPVTGSRSGCTCYSMLKQIKPSEGLSGARCMAANRDIHQSAAGTQAGTSTSPFAEEASPGVELGGELGAVSRGRDVVWTPLVVTFRLSVQL